MIIEPTPTNPRSPLRRALRVAGLILPVVLLGAVIGLGALGPRPEPPALEASPVASQLADASSLPDQTAPPRQTPAGPLPSFPTVAADLEVLSVPAAQPRLTGATGLPIAVAGYLSDVSGPAECAL
jgi:hypothetical protein